MVLRLDHRASWSDFDNSQNVRVANQNKKAQENLRPLQAETFMSTNPVENGKRGEYLDTGYYLHKGKPQENKQSVEDEEITSKAEREYLQLPGIQGYRFTEFSGEKKTDFTEVKEASTKIKEINCTINPRTNIASISIKNQNNEIEFKSMDKATLGHWLLSTNF